MGPEEGSTPVDNVVTQFSTYEDFLDSQITTVDLYYLEDEGLARQLVELGYRGTGEAVKREDFEARKAAIETARLAERTQKKTLASAGKDLQDNFLKALAAREEDNRSGKVSSVIFIRDRNSHGQEVSGYIDYAHRLKIEDFEVYFSGKKRLLPKPTDMRYDENDSDYSAELAATQRKINKPKGHLHIHNVKVSDEVADATARRIFISIKFDLPRLSSFYNWDSHVAVWNSTPNYQVIADNPEGLLFKYKRDRKILNVDPKAQPGDNSTRTPIRTDLYIQTVIFDHVSRRKT